VDSVDQAVAAIQSGRPVILPTDTVYGLCASPYREAPTAEVYRLKGRPETIPSALMCADVDWLFECVPELRGRSGIYVRALLPGPYTLVLPNPARRFRWLNGLARDTIGVRVPVLEGAAGEVLPRVGAVMATSANRHRGREPKSLDDIPVAIRDACATVIDAGELAGLPSTVLDLTGPEPRVLREGAVPAAEALALVAAVAA
jgi:L-threonylcarbamoyladenylate synthase